MYGTLRGALAARKVDVDPNKYHATVEGRIEATAHTIRITEINIHYDLEIPREKRDEAERALRVHPQGCASHESVKDAIKVSWTADIKEK
jgi:uncharacterized OsmC-like protein